jgi:hypothetical protein
LSHHQVFSGASAAPAAALVRAVPRGARSDPHGDAALTHREEIDDGLAEHGIDHAPSHAGEKEAAEEHPEARDDRGESEAARAQGQSAQEGWTHAPAIGEMAGGKREEQPAQVDRGNDEGDVQAREAEAFHETGGERRDPEHAEGAHAVGHGEEREEEPASR